MTIFGKILVVINLAYSLLGFTWGVFVLVNPTESPDKVAKYKDIADGERKSVRLALNNRDLATEALRVAETGIDNPKEVPASIPPGRLRHLERDWQDAELRHLRVGDPEGAPKSNNLRAIEVDEKNAVPKVEDEKNGGRPVLGVLKDREQGDKPIVQPLEVLNKTRQEALQSIVGENKKIDTLKAIIDEHINLTVKLVGDPDKKLKGLQQQLIDERIKSEKLLKQLEDLRPLYVNSAVESELILRRLEAVKQRFKELQKQPAGEK